MFHKSIFSAAILGLVSTNAFAQTSIQEKLQSYLYEKGVSSGISHFQSLENANPAEKNFALGTLHFFHAIEGLQQDLYRYGAGNVTRNRGFNPFSGLRVPVPQNPNPEQITYEKSRQIFTQFTSRMDASRKNLAKMTNADIKFPINTVAIALDTNANGVVEKDEKLVLSTLLGLGGTSTIANLSKSDQSFEFNFDTADAKWLQAYANLLSTSANFMLAFNYEKSYDVGFQLFFGEKTNAFSRKLAESSLTDDEIAKLTVKLDELKAEESTVFSPTQKTRLRELDKRNREIRRNKNYSKEEKKAEQAKIEKERSELRALSNKSNSVRRQIRELDRKIKSKGAPRHSDIMDVVSFLHTINWEVIDRQRLLDAKQNLLNVAKLNRETWALVRAETDDDKEWLPNPKQTSPFPHLEVTDKRINAWLNNVSLMEKTLNGELLVPNMRLSRGFNLKKYIEGTDRFDLVLFLTGPDVIEYTEKGEVWDQFRLNSMSGPFGRNAGQFALWFN